MQNEYLIILVAPWLKGSHKGVQAAHAAFEFSRQFPEVFNEHPHFIILEGQDYKSEIHLISEDGYDYVDWRDSYFEMEITAIAFGPVQKDSKPAWLKDYKLLRN